MERESDMGSAKFTFKRYEKKYLLSREKYESLRQLLDPHIVPDEYFESTVCSIYYDSDDYHLIRYSIERPVYKEKLRLRSYNVPADGDSVFVELKKKYKGVVYKRRIRMRADEAPDYLNGSIPAPKPSQMSREIDWFLRQNKPKPKVFIACDRQAYVASDDPDLRITFDHNMRWRETELDLRAGSHGDHWPRTVWCCWRSKRPEPCRCGWRTFSASWTFSDRIFKIRRLLQRQYP